MPKKKAKRKKPTKSKTKKAMPVKSVPKTENEQIQILIKYSEANIKGDGSALDDFFTKQVERLALMLEG